MAEDQHRLLRVLIEFIDVRAELYARKSKDAEARHGPDDIAHKTLLTRSLAYRQMRKHLEGMFHLLREHDYDPAVYADDLREKDRRRAMTLGPRFGPRDPLSDEPLGEEIDLEEYDS